MASPWRDPDYQGRTPNTPKRILALFRGHCEGSLIKSRHQGPERICYIPTTKFNYSVPHSLGLPIPITREWEEDFR